MSDDEYEFVKAEDTLKSIVIDTGGYSVKCGIGGSLSPTNIFPTIISKPKEKVACYWKKFGVSTEDYYIGDEGIKTKVSMFNKINPICNGLIKDENWDDIQKIWNYSIKTVLKTVTNDNEYSENEDIKYVCCY